MASTKTKKTKKIPGSSVLKTGTRFFFGRIVPVMIFGAIAVILFLGVKNFFLQSDYFALKAVETEGTAVVSAFDADDVMRRFNNANIFLINVQQVARYLRTRYLDIEEVVVRKILPDRVSVAMRLREAVALVRDKKYIPIDHEGVILSNAAPGTGRILPVIDGVRLRRRELENKKCTSRNITVALALLAAIEYSGILSDHDVSVINASDYKNPSFFIDDGIEIKVKKGDYKAPLKRLIEMLKDPHITSDRVRYIDLRFKEGVIGPK